MIPNGRKYRKLFRIPVTPELATLWKRWRVSPARGGQTSVTRLSRGNPQIETTSNRLQVRPKTNPPQKVKSEMAKRPTVPVEKYLSVLSEANKARMKLRTLEWMQKKYGDTETSLMEWEDQLWEHIKEDQGLLRPEDVILKVRLIYEAMAVPC